MSPHVGTRLGKLVIIKYDYPPDEIRRYRYPGRWYLTKCDCGNEKWLPRQGIAGYRSCGCVRYNFNKITANETIKYTPDRTLPPRKEMVYADL